LAKSGFLVKPDFFISQNLKYMKFILGKKQEMTQKFKEDGTVIPVTAISAGPCFVTQIKDNDKDGYKAIQVGYQEAKKINRPLSGHLKNIFKAKQLREFRLGEKDEQALKKGDQITVNVFTVGDIVKVSGNSKGRGFQGVVKRHGFKGQKASHGNKDQLRAPGSIGATGPAHVFKGTKMGGRMGGVRISVTNLEIIDIDPVKNLLFVKGAVPGARNGLIEISGPGEMDLTVKKEESKKEVKKEEVKDKKEANEEAKLEEKPDKEKESVKEEVKPEETKEAPKKEESKPAEKQEKVVEVKEVKKEENK
jgi:large subunit ribosomal protein L3